MVKPTRRRAAHEDEDGDRPTPHLTSSLLHATQSTHSLTPNASSPARDAKPRPLRLRLRLPRNPIHRRPPSRSPATSQPGHGRHGGGGRLNHQALVRARARSRLRRPALSRRHWARSARIWAPPAPQCGAVDRDITRSNGDI
ncbi:hypothetical protein ZWY2020_011704 [Hordeum vulgare]|nr:hypothetical protein ZWY2020_011704 [Hordeum vulgare]